MKKNLSKIILIFATLFYSFCFSQTDDLGIKKIDLNNIEPRITTKEENSVFVEVEQLLEFPGGVNALRSRVSQNFDSSNLDGESGMVKTEITFVVEQDGTISDVRAIGNNYNFNQEAINSVKKVQNKWSPAKINGRPVRYKFRLPLTMNFE